MSKLSNHLQDLPEDLVKALERTYRDLTDHFLIGEWDDAQVDAGRYCEGVLRYLQWRMKATYTPIDGKSKPNRKAVVTKAREDSTLPPSLRTQVPQAVELIMDFRNNRNAAHLGDIDPNALDARCVVQNCTWVMGEILRLQSQADANDVQQVINELADRQIPLIQMVGKTPIVLDAEMQASSRALIVLHKQGGRATISDLREWTEYANPTRWRSKILHDLQRKKRVHVDSSEVVHLLHPGEAEAERLLIEHGVGFS